MSRLSVTSSSFTHPPEPIRPRLRAGTRTRAPGTPPCARRRRPASLHRRSSSAWWRDPATRSVHGAVRDGPELYVPDARDDPRRGLLRTRRQPGGVRRLALLGSRPEGMDSRQGRALEVRLALRRSPRRTFASRTRPECGLEAPQHARGRKRPPCRVRRGGPPGSAALLASKRNEAATSPKW